MLPGWFGFGSAVKAYTAAHPVGGEALQAMHKRWPFFRTLLSNMDMVMSKSSLAIASRYARLVDDVPLREKIFARIAQEWRDLVEALNTIMGQQQLLESNPLLDRSIPQPVPLSRSPEPRAGRAFEIAPHALLERKVLTGIQLTINGVSAGLRNSG